jgi:hypothetical protein
VKDRRNVNIRILHLVVFGNSSFKLGASYTAMTTPDWRTKQNSHWFGLVFKTNILPVPLSGQSRPVRQLSHNLQ